MSSSVNSKKLHGPDNFYMEMNFEEMEVEMTTYQQVSIARFTYDQFYISLIREGDKIHVYCPRLIYEDYVDYDPSFENAINAIQNFN